MNDKIMVMIKCLILDEPTKDSGLIYPKHIISNAISRVQHKIDNRKFFGIITGSKYVFDSRVILANVSHSVTNLEIIENELIANIEVLLGFVGLSAGDILKEIIDSGILIEGCVIGTGSIKDNTVQEDYSLIRIDVKPIFIRS